ncbi:hypothetical protein ASF06_03320 [Agreia sp. Leaf244]|uniref:hypothetical protein n=1 Tax=Agreia sp. Leaf244 TaxID=1736305 RepID=UPI0006F26153|nr:hypothetical protein [Agreia sp. Leaf244]KQO11675.1 hypothetical protein ASF06_03320 [Agreia sp. Leaf244]
MHLENATLGDIAERLRELFEADRGRSSADALLESAATWDVSERTAASQVQLGREIGSHLSNTGLPCPSRFPAV